MTSDGRANSVLELLCNLIGSDRRPKLDLNIVWSILDCDTLASIAPFLHGQQPSADLSVKFVLNLFERDPAHNIRLLNLFFADKYGLTSALIAQIPYYCSAPSTTEHLMGLPTWALTMAQYAANVIDVCPSSIRDVTLRLHRAMLSSEFSSEYKHRYGSATMTMSCAISRLEETMLSASSDTFDTFDAARQLLFILSMRLRFSSNTTRVRYVLLDSD